MRVASSQWSVGNKSLLCFTLCAVFFTFSTSSHAQQPTRIPRIGYVSGNNPDNPGLEIKSFRQGLQDLGYIEGKNISIEYRYQEGKAERGPILVNELVKLNVDLLVVMPSRAIRAAKQATQTIPIVIATTADPVTTGLVNSLARPGGNITGVTRITRVLNGKRLELLKEVMSPPVRIGVLFQVDSTSGSIHFKEYETEARALKIDLQSLGIQGQDRKSVV